MFSINLWIINLKWMNFMIYKLQLKKAIKNMIKLLLPVSKCSLYAGVLNTLGLIIKLIMNAILDLKWIVWCEGF